MKKHTLKKILTTALASALLTASVVTPVSAAEIREVSLTKISNPYNGPREIDGLVEGGDRETSYAWCMAARGDYVYIGTNKNIGGMVVKSFVNSLASLGISEETTWALADAVSNGEVPRPYTTEGGQILRCNCITNEIEVIYTAPLGTSFRMAITHDNNVYFGSYAVGTAGQTQSNDIFRIDENDNVEKVFSSFNGTSMRAACEFDGQLYFGGVDASEELEEGYEDCAKLAVLVMDNDDNSSWGRVADYRDFGKQYAADPSMFSPITSPIWDICTYNGEIYATLPNTLGFAVFKGHPAKDGETANEYGWCWSEVVGYNNGINPIGMNPDANDATGNYISILATPVVFNDELYLFDFDNTVVAESAAFNGLLKQMNGASLKPSDYLRSVYMTLRHPQSLWKLDNATGQFTKVENFSKLLENTTNEYVWRAEEYDGELYITTMDSAVIYDYLTKLTNGSFLNKAPEELLEQIGHIINLILEINPDLSEKAQQAQKMLEDAANQLTELVLEAQESEGVAEFIDEYSDVIAQVSEAISDLQQEYLNEELAEQIIETLSETEMYTAQKLAELEEKVRDFLGELDLSKMIAPDLEQPFSTLSEEEMNTYVDALRQRLDEAVEELRIEVPELGDAIDTGLINDLFAAYMGYLADDTINQIFLQKFEEVKDSIPEELQQQIETLAKVDPQAAADLIRSKEAELKENVPESVRNTLDELASMDIDAMKEQYKAAYNDIATNFSDIVAEQITQGIGMIPENVMEEIIKQISELPPEQQLAALEAFSNTINNIQEQLMEEQPEVNKRIDMLAENIQSLTTKDLNQLIDDYADAYTEIAADNVAKAIADLQAQGIELPEDAADQIAQKVNEEIDHVKAVLAGMTTDLGLDENTPVGDIVKEMVNAELQEFEDKINVVYNYVKGAVEGIDWDGLTMYAYISDMVKVNTWGFDMFRTSDGVNFNFVTNDGFGDRFNYGGRSMVATPYGLYIGTANPFYGAQLYRLTNVRDDEPDAPAPVDEDSDLSNPDDSGKDTDNKGQNGDNSKEDSDNNHNGGEDHDTVNTADQTSALGALIAGVAAAGTALLAFGRKKREDD